MKRPKLKIYSFIPFCHIVMKLHMIKTSKKYVGSAITNIFNIEMQSKNLRNDIFESNGYIVEAPDYNELSIPSMTSQVNDFNRYGGMDAQTDINTLSVLANEDEEELWKKYQKRKEA